MNLFFNSFIETCAPPRPFPVLTVRYTTSTPTPTSLLTALNLHRPRWLALTSTPSRPHTFQHTVLPASTCPSHTASEEPAPEDQGEESCRGLEGISSELLKSCADRTCGVAENMFNLKLRGEESHSSGKHSTFTSHLMKTLEQLVLLHLDAANDPLQFAYKPGTGLNHSVILFLHQALTHPEKNGSTVRVTFFDLSSALNTISTSHPGF